MTTAGRPSGFSVFQKDGSENPAIKIVITAPDKIRIYLNEYMKGGTLWYSRETNTYCNFTDKVGLALPVSCIRIPVK